MKTFLALLALFAMASAQTCDECKDGILRLGAFILRPEEEANVITALQDIVCGGLDEQNQEGCAVGMATHWPPIAKGLFEFPDTPNDICSNIGYCKQSIFRQDVTCEECLDNIGKVANLLTTDEDFQNQVVSKVKDPIYCATFEGDDVDTCNMFVDLVGPQSVGVLGDVARQQADRICEAAMCTP